MKKAEVEKKTLRIEDIKPHPKNPKDHWEEGLEESIGEMGYIEPIVVDEDNQLLAGHGRVKVMRRMGYEELDAIVVKGLSEEQKEKYLLMSNKIGERGGWDDELLQVLDKDVLAEAGFESEELDDLFAEVEEDDFEVEDELKEEPQAKRGDIYKLGDHRLMCGDAIEEKDVEKLVDGKKANMVFTDPPYSVNYESRSGHSYSKGKYGGGEAVFDDNKTSEQAYGFYKKVLDNIYKYTEDNVPLYWWFGSKRYRANTRAVDDAGWHESQLLIWLKGPKLKIGLDFLRTYEQCIFGWKKGETHYTNKKISNLRDAFNLDFGDFELMLDTWYEKRVPVQEYKHPTQNPIGLVERALKKSSKRDDIVIDLFGGSGSTLIACEQLNRKCYMMELDPKYVDVIIERWEQYTGEEVEKINHT